jgi:hypothetical protein
MEDATGTATSSALLSLDACEDRIEHLLRLCASVCAGLSEVAAESPAQVAADAREFHCTLRLIYASILAHIRAHAGEVHLRATTTASQTGAGGGGAGGAAGAAVASAAREYRRNVYLDAQQMAVMLESLDIVKRRIEYAQAAQQQIPPPQPTPDEAAAGHSAAVVQR